MKTPLQELIDELSVLNEKATELSNSLKKDNRLIISMYTSEALAMAYKIVINKCQELKKKEKQIIIAAVNKTDQKNCEMANRVNKELFNHDPQVGEEYFNETFTNEN